MAQHDYNLANQSGADFRADLNNALSAIVTVNSGAIAPSTTFAHQLWVDTSSNVLKIRNAANDAWVTTGLSITADNTFDINGGTVDGITALSFSTGASVTSILDEDNLGSDSATALATQQSIKAYVDSQVGSVDTLAEILLNGNTTGGTDIEFGDNDKAVFGNSSDLEIYHDGSASYIVEQGEGSLIIRGGLNTYIQNTNGVTMAAFGIGGTAQLRYNGVTKLVTSSTGIDVTGDITANAENAELQLVDTSSGNTTSILSNNFDTTISADGRIFFRAGGSNDNIIQISSGGDVSFYDDTGTSENLKWDASADTLNFVDNAKATFGASNDLEIYHDGSNSYIQDSGTGNLRIAGQSVDILNPDANEFKARFLDNGAAELYYDNSKKLATTSTGIDVTGTVTSDGLTVDAALATINAPSNNADLILSEGGTNTDARIRNSNGILQIGADINNEFGASEMQFSVDGKEFLSIDRFGDISFYDDTGSSQALFWDASAESLTIGSGTANPPAPFVVSNSETGGFLAKFTSGNFNSSGNWLGLGLGYNSSFMKAGILAEAKDGNARANLHFALNGQTGSSNVGLSDSKMTITYDGSVGIGTDSPTSYADTTLHVSGSTGSTLKLSSDNSGNTDTDGFDITHSGATAFINNRENGDMVLRTNNTEALRVDSSQRVGIGTSSIDAKLHVESSSDTFLRVEKTGADNLNLIATGAGSRVRGSGDLIFDTGGGNERARIKGSNGNFSIGTTSASEKLTIEGNTFLSGDNRHVYFGGGNTFIGERSNSTHLELRGGGSSAAQTVYIDNNGRLGLGTASPDTILEAEGATAEIRVTATTTNGGIGLHALSTNASTRNWDIRSNSSGLGTLDFRYGSSQGAAPSNVAMTMNSSGLVGIGTTPTRALDVSKSGSTILANFKNTGGTSSFITLGNTTSTADQIRVGSNGTALTFSTNYAERMRIDASGNVMLGKTSVDAGATQGFEFRADLNDLLYLARAGNAITLNRLSSDGDIALFRKDGTTVGSIGASSGDIYIGTGDTGVRFHDGTNSLFPVNTTTNANVDDSINIGHSTARFKDLYLSGSAFIDTQMRLANGSASEPAFAFSADHDTGVFRATTNQLGFATGGSEAGRFDASGNLLVGKTSNNNTAVGVSIRPNEVSAVRDGGNPLLLNRLSSDGEIAVFRKDGTTVGSVSVTSSATTYNTTSDARLKDVTGEARGLEVITKLNPVAYNWKADGKADEGLIAQEVKELVPNAVTGSEDEHYQMDYSKLVTHLVKGMKEQQEQIESLKSEIANLKGE